LLKNFIVAFVVVILSCIPVAASENVLYWNLGQAPGSIDPSFVTKGASAQLAHALFLGLTDIDDATFEVIPRLASSWQTEDGGLSWTFYMRKDAMWSDGTPLTAHDLVFAIKRSLNPELASPPAAELPAAALQILKSAKDFVDNEASSFDLGIRAIDNHTVLFTLSKPNTCFPALVADPAFYPQPRSIVEEYGTDWILPEHIVTSGPYVLGQWIRDDHIVLYKSDTYYDADNVSIDEIYCHMLTDEELLLSMYERGKLDVISMSKQLTGSVMADPSIEGQLHIYPDDLEDSVPECLPEQWHSYAELSKPYLIRSFSLFGIQKWENWEIRR
jgi:ABC-type oligopeptide transport system substrate-binding subunit